MHAVGTALAWAVAEELIAAKACTIFATHFIELENLAHIYPSAFTSHMSSEDNEGEYVLTHQVRTPDMLLEDAIIGQADKSRNQSNPRYRVSFVQAAVGRSLCYNIVSSGTTDLAWMCNCVKLLEQTP